MTSDPIAGHDRHFRSYGKGSEDWAWEMDLDGRLTFVSENVVHTLGYAPAELLGRVPFEFTTPEESVRLAGIFEEIKATAAPFAAVEQLALHRDGHRMVLESCAMPVFDASGKLRGYRGMSRDITQLKRAERALRDSERQLREAQRIAKLGHYTLWVAAGDWSSSEELDRIFGLGPDYARTVEGWLKIVHPDDRETMQRHLTEHVLRDGKPFDRQYRIVRQSDGALRWVHGLGRLISDPEAGQLLMVGTIQDITERKATELALAESESRFRFVTEAMHEGVWDWNPATNKISLSESCSKMLGYKPGEIPENFPDWLALLPEADRLSMQARATACIEGQSEAYTVECRARTKAGEWRWILVRGRAVERAADGRATRIVGTLADISDRRLLEEQLRQAQKLEAVGQLAGGVAHDFNNILASMTLQLDLLELEAQGGHPPGDGLREIRKAALRAAGLTRQLLMFSRRTQPQIRSLDLNAVAADLMKMLSRLIGENVELRLNAAPALPHILADAGMVEQVLMNLVVNARDAMPRGGRLTIATDAVRCPEAVPTAPGRTAGTCVRLIVEDTGCGMSDEVKKHLYEPFFTTKEVGHGTGLGLATIHGIVEQHRGWIEVESTVGQGTRFVVHWPAVEVANPALSAPSPRDVLARGSETILLVEDEETVRRNISRCLKQLGYTVLEAGSGQEALGVHAGRKVDLLFTDMLMPGGINGAELAVLLREKQPGLRVVISSGYISAHGEALAGAKDIVYLQKPYEHHELARTVRCCLDA